MVIHHVKHVVQLEGLAEMRCNLQRCCVVSSITGHSHHNDGDVRERCLTIGVDEFSPVHHRHIQIQENHAGQRSGDQLEPMSTVACEGDQVATIRQDIVKQVSDRGSVLYHQHAPFVAHRSSSNQYGGRTAGAKRGRNN